MKYLLAAEVDCASAKPPAKNYLELKTSRLMTQENHVNTFEKFKMLKYWAQSISVGVPRVLVGFRNDEGMVSQPVAVPIEALYDSLRLTPPS